MQCQRKTIRSTQAQNKAVRNTQEGGGFHPHSDGLVYKLLLRLCGVILM